LRGCALVYAPDAGALMIVGTLETLTDKGNEPMSNINFALRIFQLIESGRMSRQHIAVFAWLMSAFNGDRKRAGAVIDALENEFKVELIYF